MPGAHTIRLADPEWRTHPDGVRHAIPVRGAMRYACGEPVLDPRFAGSDKPKTFCAGCLDRAGVTVSPPAPRQELLGWTEGEKREAYGR